MEENKNYRSTNKNIDKNQLFKNASSAVDVYKDPLPKIGRFDERCNLGENGVFNNDINCSGSTASFGDVKENFKHNFELNKENGDGTHPRDCGKNKCQKGDNNNLKGSGSHDLKEFVAEEESRNRNSKENLEKNCVAGHNELDVGYYNNSLKKDRVRDSEKRKLPLSTRNISQLGPFFNYDKYQSSSDYENCIEPKYDQHTNKIRLANKHNIDYEPSSSEISIDDFCNVTSLNENSVNIAGLSGKSFLFSIINIIEIVLLFSKLTTQN